MSATIDLLQEDLGTIKLEQLVEAEEARLILEQTDAETESEMKSLRRRRR
mgnify:CR=1 FL=1